LTVSEEALQTFRNFFENLLSVRSMASVCDRSLVGIVSSNPTGYMGVGPIRMLRVVRSQRQADPSSRGVLPNVCVCVCGHWAWSGTQKPSTRTVYR